MVRKICDRCMGNGYRRIWKDQTESEKITIQCMKCESAGEIDEATEQKFLQKMMTHLEPLFIKQSLISLL